MKIAILLALLPVIIYALSVEDSFSAWTLQHGKEYKNQNEYNYRLSVYRNNLDFIETHNRKNLGFTVAMNQFGDLTSEEYRTLYLGVRFNASAVPRTNLATVTPRANPDSVDWRTKGAINPVKNQGQCGSCWAFSTCGSLEPAYFLKKGKLIDLSEQNLVDCSKKEGNYGCNGGLMDYAFKYIINNKGIDTTVSYPYTAKDGTCKFNKNTIGATMTSFKDIAPGNENALTTMIVQQPISVAIDASQSSFQFYSSGVYEDQNCSSEQLDHGVTAVGYGTLSGKAHYIVRNSWGTTWGMQGYILMARNENNMCGIATMSSYPIV